MIGDATATRRGRVPGPAGRPPPARGRASERRACGWSRRSPPSTPPTPTIPTPSTSAASPRPKELAHAELMTAWIERLVEHPTDAQRLAARAHHLRRWVSPRDELPRGPGRLPAMAQGPGASARPTRWRASWSHCGYDEATVDRVQAIITKAGLKHRSRGPGPRGRPLPGLPADPAPGPGRAARPGQGRRGAGQDR